MPRKRKQHQSTNNETLISKKNNLKNSCPAIDCSWVCPEVRGSKSVEARRKLFDEHVIEFSINNGPLQREHLKVLQDLQCTVCNKIFYNHKSLGIHQSKSHPHDEYGQISSSNKSVMMEASSLTFGTVPDPLSRVVKETVSKTIREKKGLLPSHLHDNIMASQVEYEDDGNGGVDFLVDEEEEEFLDRSVDNGKLSPQKSHAAHGRNSPSYYLSSTRPPAFVDFKKNATHSTELIHYSRFHQARSSSRLSINKSKSSLAGSSFSKNVIQHGQTSFTFERSLNSEEPNSFEQARIDKIDERTCNPHCDDKVSHRNNVVFEHNTCRSQQSSTWCDEAERSADESSTDEDHDISTDDPVDEDQVSVADGNSVNSDNDVATGELCQQDNPENIFEDSSYFRYHEEESNHYSDHDDNNQSSIPTTRSSPLQICIRSMNSSRGEGQMNQKIHSYVDQISSHRRTSTLVPISNMAYLDTFNILSEPGIPHNIYNKIASCIGNNFTAQIKDKTEGFIVSSQRNDFPGRTAITNWVESKVHPDGLVHLSRPKKTRMDLPTGQKVVITTNDLEYQLALIFSNTSLMRPDNFVFPDTSDPSIHPSWSPSDRTFSEVNTGIFYEKVLEEINSSLNPDIFQNTSVMPMPFLMFIDGTLVSRNSVEPVCICPAIFKRSLRNLPVSWFILGYVEQSSNYLGVLKKTKKINGRLVETDKTRKIIPREKLLCLHSQLKYILKDFIKLQKTGFVLDVPVSNGTNRPGTYKRITFIPVLQAVIGDCKGADTLCGRYGTHSGSSHLNRDCDIFHINADDVSHKCSFRRREIFDRMSELEKNAISFHHIPNNAFNNISMGNWNDGYGIYSCATPPEHLHLFQLGICEYLWEGFFDKVNKSVENRLNVVSSRIVSNIYKQTGSMDSMPEIKPFKKGVCIRTHEMTGRERFGRIFLLLLCFYDSSFIDELKDSKKREFPRTQNHTGNQPIITDEYVFTMTNILRWFQLLQWTIILDAWIISPCHNSKECMVPLDEFNQPKKSCDGGNDQSLHEPVAMTSVRAYMKLFKKVVQRTKGEGLKLTKFHQLLHLVHYICLHGSLLNIDGGRPEAIIKNLVKVPGRMTQNIAKEVSYQSANKLVSFRNMDHFLRMIKDHHPQIYHRYIKEQRDSETRDALFLNSIEQDKYYNPGGSRFELWYGDNELGHSGSRSMGIAWTSGTKQYSTIWNSFILSAIESELFHKRCQKNVYLGYTEMTRFSRESDGVSWKKLFMRAHPCYRSKAPWYSWVDIIWEYDHGVRDTCPAKVIMFIAPQSDNEWYSDENVFVDDDSPGRVEAFAIVQAAKQRIERRTQSSLTGILDSRWLMEDELRIVCIEALSRSVTVIEETYYQEPDKKWMVKHCNRIDGTDTWKDKFVQVVNHSAIL